MVEMETDILGVVLAGGKSSRMGTDKAAIEFDGATFVERAVSVLASVFAEVVVAGVSSVAPTVHVLPDRLPGHGPLAGLDAAFSYAGGRSVFVLALDMPFVSSSTVHALIDPRPDAMGATIAKSEGRVQPLCGIYGSGLAERVRDIVGSGDRSMARLLDALDDVRWVEVDARSTMNINSVEDLEAALKLDQPGGAAIDV